MVAGYLVIMASLGLGCGAFIFERYRKLWHVDEQNL
jgi:hypothetical protein